MSGQVSTTIEALAQAIEELDLPVDGAVLAQAFALADRLNAKLLAAVDAHDAGEVWRNDGATSMTAWLRHHTQRSGRDAARCARTALRLRDLPVTAAAYGEGVLSSGQIQAIVANLTNRTVGLFAHHEAELVPELAGLPVPDTAVAMQDWARRAQAVLGDDPEPAVPVRSLHVSRILDGRRELSGSFDPEGGAVIATALRLPKPPTRPVNPPVAPPNDAPTPSSTSAAGSSTTNTTAAVAATAPISTSSPPSPTSRTGPTGGWSTARHSTPPPSDAWSVTPVSTG